MCFICSLSGKRFKLRWSFDTLHDPLVPRALPQRLPNLRKTPAPFQAAVSLFGAMTQRKNALAINIVLLSNTLS